MRIFPLLFLCSLLAVAAGCEKTTPRDDSKTDGDIFRQNIRPTDPRTPEEERKGFILPPGFEIQLFASEPDIEKPMNIAFDAKGRMWVTSSFEYPFPMVGKTGTDKLTILEDTDGDGRADKFTRVSDTLNIPIGILPLNDGAFSFSVPNLYRLFDTDHDDRPENSRHMLGPFGYQDTHGMVSNLIRGYDGWVHACHGYTNYSKFSGSDGDSITLVSGNTFRFRMDGSRVEQLTFGQVNPFGLVFDVLGYVYSTDSHSSPLYQLIRTGDYPHFGKLSNMGFGPDMKPLEDEATSLCGITQYTDVHFPEEFRGNFFIGDVVRSRVHRYSAGWKGSSPVGKSEADFIKSEDPWFRPVNIKLGPDGALYVADFYNAIIGHYEVPLNHPKRDKQRGRIWRITYKGKDNKKADLTQLPVDKLLAVLDNENLTTRMLALDQVTDRLGAGAGENLKQAFLNPVSPRQQIHVMWAMHRLGILSEEQMAQAVASPDSLVRIHAMRVMLERPASPSSQRFATDGLADKSPHVQRAAVEVLVKTPGVENLEAVLALLRKTSPDFDNHLYYTCRLALRNMLRDEPTLGEAVAKSWSPEDASLLAGVMVDVPLPSAGIFLARFMNEGQLDKDRIPPAYAQIARFVPQAELGSVIRQAFSRDDVEIRALIYRGMRSGLAGRGGDVTAAIFAPYAPQIAAGILSKYPASDSTWSDRKFNYQRIAIEIAGDYKVASLQPALREFIELGSPQVRGMRSPALRSLLKISSDNFSVASNILARESDREYIRQQLAVMREFPGKKLNEILLAYKNIPLDVQEPVVIALGGSPEGKDLVFRKVSAGDIGARALTGNRAQEILLSKASPAQRSQFEKLTAGLAPISEEIQALINDRVSVFTNIDKSGLSLDSGRMVFEQNCGVCHKLGGQLGVGPQLDGIGATGAHGLMEKILDPNRNISKAFSNYTITLKDGTVKSGLFRREEGAARVYADVTGKEFVVEKKDISEEKLSKFTLMPDSFSSTLEERELYQLVNYLLTL